jgi:hypothetical protein
MFRENAVLDPKHLLQTGQGRLIPLKKESTPLVDVVPIPPPNIPPSAFQQLEVYDKELFNVVGLSQENLGKVVEDDSSGYQSALRTAAGLTAQQPLFDRLDLAQNMVANLTVKFAQRNFTPGKISRLLGGDQPAPQFYDLAFGKYHATCELGFNTDTQKQLEFAQKLELRNAGIAISDASMIESATLQHKDKLIEELQQNAKQQSEQAQMQHQMEMQELQSRAELSRASAASYYGSANERNSRVDENRALAVANIHKANAEDERATLDKIKVIKELEGMNIEHIRSLLEMANSIKQSEQAAAEIQAASKEVKEKNTQQGQNSSEL